MTTRPTFLLVFHTFIPLRWPGVPKNAQKCLKWGKMAQMGGVKFNISWTTFPKNSKTGWPLNFFRSIMFLLVFHIFYTSQMSGNAQKFPNRVKRDQKRSKRAIIYNSRTLGRWNLVDLSFQSEIWCFYDCFMFISYFSHDWKCSKMPN